MRKVALLVAALVLCFAPSVVGAADDDIARHPSCKFCGMDRTQWNFSRIYVELPDNASEGFCSVRCLAVWLAVSIDAAPTAIKVADLNTRELIEAEKQAVWVMGGKKQGVMTQRAKWAFADAASADAFVKENGGSITTYDLVLKGAYEDMYEDNSRIRERRAAKRKAAMEGQGKGGAPAAPPMQHPMK
jgi:copper chaperone NosL